MAHRTKTPASFTLGLVLLFLPVALGGLTAFGVLPETTWVQVTVVLVIIGCVGTGSYLVFWGKRPSRSRGDWVPSETLPGTDSR